MKPCNGEVLADLVGTVDRYLLHFPSALATDRGPRYTTNLDHNSPVLG
jgi:hypothetical protein